MEYSYTIDLSDGWTQEGEGRYSSESPWARLRIISQGLPAGYNVDQFSQLVQDGLRGEWWPTASLFEVLSVKETQADNQSAAHIRYKVQEAPQYCVLDVVELVLVSKILPGRPQSFRVRVYMCESEVANYGRTRENILNSFRVSTKPATYYTQFVPVRGVYVKAHESVDPAALQAGADIIAVMLSGREDIAKCMPLQGADLAIIPRDQTNTDLPEFAHLKGTKDFTGRSRDTYEIRGLGGVRGQPVSSAGEEQLLGNRGPEHPWMPFRGLAATHEYAHAVQNLCFREEDHRRWNKFYEEALEENLYPGSHMMHNIDEFFAVFSTAYFEATPELDPYHSREEIQGRFPEVFQALDEIYGGRILPEEARLPVPHP